MGLGRLISAVGFAVLKAEMRIIMRRLAISIATGAAAAFLFLVAAGFLIAAATVWLSQELGTIFALLIVGGVMLLLGLIIFFAGQSAGRRPPRARPRDVPPAAVASETARPDPYSPADPPPGSELGSMAVVAVAGFMLARQMFRRR
jgi:hypothetical protein